MRPHISIQRAASTLGLIATRRGPALSPTLKRKAFLSPSKNIPTASDAAIARKHVVEPRPSTQWFVKIQPLADKAIAAVEQGYIKIGPDQYRKTYLEWMRNIHDWCISRQLWWGHRIPAWHCATCKQITVARETPGVCGHRGSAEITQETDVLDTWFSSSGLLPFTVFGGPQATADLATFYPTQLLITGFDILFFWVARMIMLGCHFMLDVPMLRRFGTNIEKTRSPSARCMIHAPGATLRDWQKMSKTKGNVIDPIEIVKRFGTDAVRFTLAAMASPGTDIAFSEARTEGYRAFANKIWNAARFIFMNMDRAAEAGLTVDPAKLLAESGTAPLSSPIEASLDRLPAQHHRRRGQSRPSRNSASTRRPMSSGQFFWGDFCDWYLEIVKLRLALKRDRRQECHAVCVGDIDRGLRIGAAPALTFHAVYYRRNLACTLRSARSCCFDRADALSAVGGLAHRYRGRSPKWLSSSRPIVAVRAQRKEKGVPDRETRRSLCRELKQLPSFSFAHHLIFNDAAMTKRIARADSFIDVSAERTPQGLWED